MVSSGTWAAVRAFIHRATGVVLEDDRDYLIPARLEPVARRLGFASVDDYVRAACAPASPPRHRQQLVDAMTTHETSFFRDPGFWRTFEELVFPELRARVAGRPLAVWSAACSTGQEAYSLAMSLFELDRALFERTAIVATDVADQCLEQGREGVYSGLEVSRGLAAGRLARHFDEVAGGHRVKGGLRRRISWQLDNLLGPAPYPRGFDVIMCRNVLIYFNEADRTRVMSSLLGALAPGGYLGVGAAEVVWGPTPVRDGWFTAPQGGSR